MQTANREGNGDFSRKKTKVGKQAVRTNATNTSFRSKSLRVSTQELGKTGLEEMLRRLGSGASKPHHNPKVRVSALKALAEAASSEGFYDASEGVIGAVGRSVSDANARVRVAALHALKACTINGSGWCAPFASILLAHVGCAVSSLHVGVSISGVEGVGILSGVLEDGFGNGISNSNAISVGEHLMPLSQGFARYLAGGLTVRKNWSAVSRTARMLGSALDKLLEPSPSHSLPTDAKAEFLEVIVGHHNNKSDDTNESTASGPRFVEIVGGVALLGANFPLIRGVMNLWNLISTAAAKDAHAGLLSSFADGSMALLHCCRCVTHCGVGCRVPDAVRESITSVLPTGNSEADVALLNVLQISGHYDSLAPDLISSVRLLCVACMCARTNINPCVCPCVKC